MPAVTLRPARATDAAAMRALAESAPEAAQWDASQYDALFSPLPGAPSRLLLVAEEAGGLCGFAIALHAAGDWELENIVVASAARRRGLGAQLLGTVLAHARKSRAQRVFLEVRASNAAARALYGKLGFVAAGRRAAYYQNPVEDAIVYAFPIAAAAPKSG